MAAANRDLLVLSITISAVLVLIWNGSSFFHLILSNVGQQFGLGVKLTMIALTLNVALILFGWRRYVDLQHEAELRAAGERRAAILAVTDLVTGLANRKGFADRSEALFHAAAAANRSVVILSLQLHRFKAISDRHGYEIGEGLLRSIGAALREPLPSDAVAARISGDEFAVALTLPARGKSIADALAEAVLRSVTRPFELDERLVQVGAYIGLAVQAPPLASVSDLLRRADIALDRARAGRSARPIWFDAGMEQALIAHSEIEQGIRFGIDQGQFVPFFEPQVDLATGAIKGFEVLARWEHPTRGRIGPDSFIPVAEEIGLIGALSEQVIGQALREAATWDPAISIAVNISPTQLADFWLAHKIVRLLTETGFPPERLVIEITESSLFADLELARSIVTSLKNQGIRLALDDFGTGFSSLAHLRSLPFDVIKIDRSFVRQLQRDREAAAIVRAVANLANAIDVPITVEGIEDAATHASVLGFGCQFGQGWYFGKPMDAEAAANLLQSRHAARVESNVIPIAGQAGA
ncbi:bifunctional diguanylate cyclase/phosphodiesterase [Sphingomonas ginkgonis]|uniref:Bifunctional diguanylate cyclase/phosphodiesterase n=1 Tax=Sphingomonas ginkgonis TaxID=2315330 RepID=A0A3R9WQU1_9SPHN|nr:bifunctional diguanylate cyclase/phosphodiesterase [Sphingomonas ginkgonis]RST31227.1 bifunctional diguanylate cyclase/phosphodiesterase [Sphingomonas ginkgonis]